MLALTRKSQESVVLGGSDDFEGLLKVTALEIRRQHVRRGFEVGAQVLVHRWEVWQRTRAGGRPDRSPRRPAAPST